jgi:hypothetical protein
MGKINRKVAHCFVYHGGQSLGAKAEVKREWNLLSLR